MKNASSRQIKRLSKLLTEDPNIQARALTKRTMPSPSQRANGRFYEVDGRLVEAEGDEVLESALRLFEHNSHMLRF